jgi:hypothetical protein
MFLAMVLLLVLALVLLMLCVGVDANVGDITAVNIASAVVGRDDVGVVARIFGGFGVSMGIGVNAAVVAVLLMLVVLMLFLLLLF